MDGFECVIVELGSLHLTLVLNCRTYCETHCPYLNINWHTHALSFHRPHEINNFVKRLKVPHVLHCYDICRRTKQCDIFVFNCGVPSTESGWKQCDLIHGDFRLNDGYDVKCLVIEINNFEKVFHSVEQKQRKILLIKK